MNLSDAYVPGALTAFLSSETQLIANDTSNSKVKKRKKNVSVVRESLYTASSLFDKNTSNTKASEMPVGDTVIMPKRIKREDKEGEESKTKGETSRREIQRLNRMKKEKMTAEEKKRTVFIGNAPTSASRKIIRKLFSKYGTIESVRLRSVISGSDKTSKKVAVLKKHFSPKMHSLHFYIKFNDAHSAEAALVMNGEKLEDHRLRVDSCAAKKNYDSRTTVFVGNLPFNAQEDNLYSHFEKCGDVDFVRIVRDRTTGTGKGFAFVSFKDSAAVPIALKMDGSNFDGRPLRVTRVQKKNKRLVGKKAISKNEKKSKRSAVSERKLRKFITNNRKVVNDKGGSSRTVKKSVRKKIKKKQRNANSKSIML